MIASKLSIMFIISSGRARGGSAVIIKQDIKHNAHHSIADTYVKAAATQCMTSP